jgi:hypothetical protein
MLTPWERCKDLKYIFSLKELEKKTISTQITTYYAGKWPEVILRGNLFSYLCSFLTINIVP